MTAVLRRHMRKQQQQRRLLNSRRTLITLLLLLLCITAKSHQPVQQRSHEPLGSCRIPWRLDITTGPLTSITSVGGSNPSDARCERLSGPIKKGTKTFTRQKCVAPDKLHSRETIAREPRPHRRVKM